MAAAQTLPIRGHLLALHAHPYGKVHLQYVPLVAENAPERDWGSADGRLQTHFSSSSSP